MIQLPGCKHTTGPHSFVGTKSRSLCGGHDGGSVNGDDGDDGGGGSIDMPVALQALAVAEQHLEHVGLCNSVMSAAQVAPLQVAGMNDATAGTGETE